MKFNKWTLGLAAVGAVSMASAVRADEAPKMSQLNTALSNTTISGYVDVAAQYNPGDANQHATETPVTYAGLNGVVDGFSLNDVDIALDKPQDDSPWASGYHVDFNAGQDAINALVGSSAGVRQAYVALRTPIGSGINWKFGAFDGITGYEGNTGYSNPNYTRSYGWAINPASQVGLLGSYTVNSVIGIQAGIVNRDTSSSRNFGVAPGAVSPEPSSKTYVAALALTAPDSWGWFKGSVLNLETVQTFDGYGQNNYSASLTFNTPVTGLKGGLAFDEVQALNIPNTTIDGEVYGVYATYQQTDKLSYNLRGEYVDFPNGSAAAPFAGIGEEVTLDVEYDIFANVTSRVEARWDHNDSPSVGTFNSNGTQDAFLLALNVVYKF
jgi:hypothetical protein